MKLTRILALILSCLMIVCAFASCGGDGNGDGDTTPADDTQGGDATDVKLTVSIKVLDGDSNVVYENEAYNYSGEAPNLIELLDDYLYMDHDTAVDYDEYGTLASVGSVEAGVVTSHDADKNEDVTLYTTYWWYRLNGREGSDAMEEYIVQSGDAIEYYLAQKK